MLKKKKEHYVDNAKFNEALIIHVESVARAREAGKTPPVVPDYIADCFLKIANGLRRTPNFSNYTYGDEMVMDAVENMLRAVSNYNPNASTRTGKPNAFAYFTQITWYAFIRRIKIEQKQELVKEEITLETELADILNGNLDGFAGVAAQGMLDAEKQKIDDRRTMKGKTGGKAAAKKPRKRRAVHADSDLGDLL